MSQQNAMDPSRFGPSSENVTPTAPAVASVLEASLAILAGDADSPRAEADPVAAYELHRSVVQAASEPFGAAQDQVAGAYLIDVRRARAYEQAATLIAGSRWRDPRRIVEWAETLPADRQVIVYCVHGHEVSRAAALQLRSRGVPARWLRGGIDAWQSAQRPLDRKGVAP